MNGLTEPLHRLSHLQKWKECQIDMQRPSRSDKNSQTSTPQRCSFINKKKKTKKYSKGTFNNVCIPLLTSKMWRLPRHPQLQSGMERSLSWNGMRYLYRYHFENVQRQKHSRLTLLLIDPISIEYGKDSTKPRLSNLKVAMVSYTLCFKWTRLCP